MSRIALLLAAAVGLSCSGCDTRESAAGLFGPCERQKDCAGGLSCDAGVCISSGNPPDGLVSGLTADGWGNDQANDSDVVDAAASNQ